MSILCTNQLAEITCRRLIDYTSQMSQITQRADIGMAKLSLDEAKTGIRRELGVASTQKVKPDGVVMEWCSPGHKLWTTYSSEKMLSSVYISALCM